jgi:hypothetical protein
MATKVTVKPNRKSRTVVWETAHDVDLQLRGLMRHLIRYGDAGLGAKLLVADSDSNRVQTLPFKSSMHPARRISIRQMLRILSTLWKASVDVATSIEK